MTADRKKQPWSWQSGRVLASLRSATDGLSPALARVSARVLADPETALGQTITELAEASGSSEASITRFCRELGFKSFQHLKLALASELASGVHRPLQSAREGPGPLIDAAHAAMRDTEALLDPAVLAAACDRLLRARRIVMFGFGASMSTVHFLHYRLTRLGLAAIWSEDLHLSSMIASQLGTRDLAVAVSSSGSTRDTVRIAGLARAAGAEVLALTSRAKSPLAGMATLTLTTAPTGNLLNGSGFPSGVSQMLVVELIYERIARADKKAAAAIEATLGSVAERVY